MNIYVPDADRPAGHAALAVVMAVYRQHYAPRTCASCQFAVPRQGANVLNTERDRADFAAFPLLCDRMREAALCDDECGPANPDSLAYAVDNEQYYGSPGIHMKPSFGCVMWMAKKA